MYKTSIYSELLSIGISHTSRIYTVTTKCQETIISINSKALAVLILQIEALDVSLQLAMLTCMVKSMERDCLNIE